MDASFFGTQVYMKVHFDYKPETDRLIPSREAGLPFTKGDILEVGVNEQQPLCEQLSLLLLTN